MCMGSFQIGICKDQILKHTYIFALPFSFSLFPFLPHRIETKSLSVPRSRSLLMLLSSSSFYILFLSSIIFLLIFLAAISSSFILIFSTCIFLPHYFTSNYPSLLCCYLTNSDLYVISFWFMGAIQQH